MAASSSTGRVDLELGLHESEVERVLVDDEHDPCALVEHNLVCSVEPGERVVQKWEREHAAGGTDHEAHKRRARSCEPWDKDRHEEHTTAGTCAQVITAKPA